MKRQQGLTLVELMVTVAVAIILLAIGVPAMDRFAANNRTTGANNGLVGALRLARGEAVNRATPVTVCALANAFTSGNDGGACATGAPNWRNGFRVFVESDPTGTATVFDSDDHELRIWKSLASDLSMAIENANNNNVRAFRFNLLGEVQHYVQSDSAAYEVDVLVDLTNTGSAAAGGAIKRRCIQVLASGLVRTYLQPDSTKTCDDAALL